MKMLKPGDPCPLCGQPIPDGLPTKTMIYLSWMAEVLPPREAAMDGSEDINAE